MHLIICDKHTFYQFDSQQRLQYTCTMDIHDSGYKLLFSNKTIFRQLIETFVEEPWVQNLEFERAVRLDKSFISKHYQQTEGDIIYHVPLKKPDDTETEVYFYILIEFQSGV